ncbi:MAG TPA: rhodanese-like domain-containing protein [Candidatus Eisenbacteria bacterium]|nr:rhodanese-like domain-containing protein [Candidatus Eisenbacteria bacterium]
MRDHFLEFEISPELVNEMLESGENTILLDIREDWEWEKAHLEGAIHIPLDELTDRVSELDPRSEIVVYCHHGDRSVDGCLVLWEHGFRKVRSLTGGIEAWSELVDPTVPRY